MVVDPPGELLPVPLRLEAVSEGRQDDAGGSAHEAIRIPAIPDVSGVVRFIRCTAISAFARTLHLVAETIDLGRAEGRAESDPSESSLQRFEQIFAQSRAGSDREIGIVGHIVETVDRSDVGKEEIPHEEGLRQAHAAKFGEAGDAGRLLHSRSFSSMMPH